ncbi:hypothetical protein EVAR_77488_1 [Eumeta japonica]|uniref:Uncharacterized protein n=1 Tax=Eumeta variegata TaxID=151549 RepID=A0A4C1T6A9_EUMVA|nr:hypothetical protein EVAR_77488_1 [Eumeta japonica]
MRAALIRSASTSVRPPAVGCVCSLSCASLPPSSSTNHQAGCHPPCWLRMRDDRARPRAVWRRHRHDSRNNGSNHCHLIRRGRIPDEKTPGHEAKYKFSVPYPHP